MAWELVYTSSPEGLAPGTRGFCTVAASLGLPASLGPRLEALSGYRPRYGADDPEEAVHPVQHTHVLLDQGGQRLSVLSRIAHAGSDYSGRTNKLAAHLVLPADERAAAGPAWVLSRPGVMRTAWVGSARVLPTAPEVPRGDATPGVCERWAEAVGDAGWAGVLAEQFLLDPAAPFYVVYDPRRHDPLRLIHEAVVLLPPTRRWDVTFATYYTDPVGESGVAWRFVVAGTAAEKQAVANQTKHRFLDLTASPGAPNTSRYVQFARTGHDAEPEPRAVPADAEAAASGPYEIADPLQAKAVPGANAPIAVSPLSSPHVDTQPPRKGRVPLTAGPLRTPRHSATRSRLPVAAVALVALVVAAAGYLIWSQQHRADAHVVGPRDEAERIAALEDELEAQRRHAAALQEELEQRRAAPSPTRSPGTPDPAFPTRTLTSASPLYEANPTASDINPNGTAAALASSPEPTTDSTDTDVDLPTDPDGRDQAAALSSDPGVRQVFAELPRPRLEALDARGVGASSRLAPHQATLWQPDSSSQAGLRLTVRPPTVRVAEPLVEWDHSSDGTRLLVRSLDALGTVRHTTIADASLSTKGLVWAWHAAELSRDVSDRLDEVWREVAATTFDVTGTDRLHMTRVQGIKPPHASVRVDGPPIPVHEALPPLALRLEIQPDADAWAATPQSDGSQINLIGAGGAWLEIELLPAMRGPRQLEARWAQTPARLTAEITDADGRAAELADWIDQYDRLHDDLQDAKAALPRTVDGQIDHNRRIELKHSAAFARYDAADTAYRELMEHDSERDPEAARARAQSLRQVADTLRVRLAAMQAFPGVEVQVVVEGSDAVLGVFEVEGAVNDD